MSPNMVGQANLFLNIQANEINEYCLNGIEFQNEFVKNKHLIGNGLELLTRFSETSINPF